MKEGRGPSGPLLCGRALGSYMLQEDAESALQVAIAPRRKDGRERRT